MVTLVEFVRGSGSGIRQHSDPGGLGASRHRCLLERQGDDLLYAGSKKVLFRSGDEVIEWKLGQIVWGTPVASDTTEISSANSYPCTIALDVENLCVALHRDEFHVCSSAKDDMRIHHHRDSVAVRHKPN